MFIMTITTEGMDFQPFIKRALFVRQTKYALVHDIDEYLKNSPKEFHHHWVMYDSTGIIKSHGNTHMCPRFTETEEFDTISIEFFKKF